jgi:hypothetical protein
MACASYTPQSEPIAAARHDSTYEFEKDFDNTYVES